MLSNNVWLLAIWLATLPGTLFGVDMEGVLLLGGTGEYMEVSGGIKYQLQCIYRAGYDDQVHTVEWRYYGKSVYTWIEGRTTISVNPPLLGHVDSSPANDPHFLHFTKVVHDLVGNYTCVVNSSKGVAVSKPFKLQIVDVAPAEFETHVHVLGDMKDDLNDPSSTEKEMEDEDCTLVWDFKSPAIYPRPNVTCGYYSYDFDDVTTQLPAGLSLHQLLNGSWQAVFDHTAVKVKDIPVHGRLGCSIKIPETTYKKLVKFDNDLVIDSKIDATGCPAPHFTRSQRILYQVKDATVTCRGDLLPSNRDSPVKVMLRCPDYHTALFKNGTSQYNWKMVAACTHQELTWRSSENMYDNPGEILGDVISFENLPYCVSGFSGASSLLGFSFVFKSYFIISVILTKLLL